MSDESRYLVRTREGPDKPWSYYALTGSETVKYTHRSICLNHNARGLETEILEMPIEWKIVHRSKWYDHMSPYQDVKG